MRKEKIEPLKLFIILFALFISIASITISTYTYFKYKKVYDSDGDLPILKINATINTADFNSLKNIIYNGQSGEDIVVTLNTTGNNTKGLVRVKVAVSWSNLLNNTTYNTNNELVTACKVTYNTDIWQEKNGFLYLKTALDKNSEVELFSSVKFGENLPSEYRGEAVDIYLITEIYQENNVPGNW